MLKPTYVIAACIGICIAHWDWSAHQSSVNSSLKPI